MHSVPNLGHYLGIVHAQHNTIYKQEFYFGALCGQANIIQFLLLIIYLYTPIYWPAFEMHIKDIIIRGLFALLYRYLVNFRGIHAQIEKYIGKKREGFRV